MTLMLIYIELHSVAAQGINDLINVPFKLYYPLLKEHPHIFSSLSSTYRITSALTILVKLLVSLLLKLENSQPAAILRIDQVNLNH